MPVVQKCIIDCFCVYACVFFTCATDLQMYGEDGVWTGGVFVHQGVAHSPVPPALLHDPLTLSHTVHSVHRQVPHIDPTLWMFLQLTVNHVHRHRHTKSALSKLVEIPGIVWLLFFHVTILYSIVY